MRALPRHFTGQMRICLHKKSNAAQGVPARSWCATLLAIALLTAAASGQVSTGSHRPVSAGVLASWRTQGDKLTLLVLWRGTPGWWSRANHGGGGGGGNGEREFQQIREGGLTFQIDYDFRAGTASLVERTISLTDVNVILVDNVDGPTRPVIVGMRFIDPQLPASEPDAPLAMIRREPELYEFLRCDVGLPPSREAVAPLLDEMITRMCAYLRPR